jgi:hypothetical protein
MSYESLKDKYGKIVKLDISDDKAIIKVDLPVFNIKEMKGKHVEFVQYVAFIYLKIKEFINENKSLSNMHINMKDAGIKHFSPSFLKKVLTPLNQLVNGDDTEVLEKIYVYHVNKYVKQIWKGVKRLFHPITVNKFVIVN